MPELNEENVWSLTFDNWKSRQEVSGRQKFEPIATESSITTHEDCRNEKETINMDSALDCDRNRNLLWYNLTRSKETVWHFGTLLI